MNRNLVKRLCLGTAQFGLHYGIANRRGMIPEAEAFSILDYAHDSGITTLDSAYSYGDSETVIGRFMAKSGKAFDVLSKTPHFDEGYTGVRKSCGQTLKRLGLSAVKGYLVHSFKDIVKFAPGLWNDMVALKKAGMAGNIGVSVYKPEDIGYLRSEKLAVDIMQIPYSVFDRRFDTGLDAVKGSGALIYARSVFLQGLAFMDPSELAGGLSKAVPSVSALKKLSRNTGISINAICLNFALADTRIDKVVIGVDSLEHLKKNIEDTGSFEDVKKVRSEMGALRIEEEDVLLPYMWGSR